MELATTPPSAVGTAETAWNNPNCHVDYPSWIGDGWCAGGACNTAPSAAGMVVVCVGTAFSRDIPNATSTILLLGLAMASVMVVTTTPPSAVGTVVTV